MLRRLLPGHPIGGLVALLLAACLITACGSSSPRSTTTTSTAATGSRTITPLTTTTRSTTQTSTNASVPLGAPRSTASLQSIFEAEGPLHSDPAALFAEARRLGVDRVRVYMTWNQLTPNGGSTVKPNFNASDPAAYGSTVWAQWDTIDRAAAAAHMPILLTVGGPGPYWADGPGIPTAKTALAQAQGGWRLSAADFGQFVHALGTRYSGHYIPAGQSTPLPRIDFWSIWNEPNFGDNISPQGADHGTVAVAPKAYRGLVDAAWSALVATGHGPGTDTILLGETAPVSNSATAIDFSITAPLLFIRDVYCVNSSYTPLTGTAATDAGCPTSGSAAQFRSENPALFEATGWADHPYDSGTAPTVKPPEPDSADFASISNLISTLRGVQRAYGSAHDLPVYSTEFGYNTYELPGSQANKDSLAAEYLNETEYLSWLNPQIRSDGQYLLEDPQPGQGDFFTGLENANGTPKPDIYDAYEMPLYLPRTTTTAGGTLTVWGCARPSVQEYPDGTTVAVQFAPAHGGYATLVRAHIDPRTGGCYFETSVKIPASGSIRLLYHGSTGVLSSRVQPVTAG